ncbi:MAG: hypothetical protein BGO90_11610 [Legionella sp. 40-6]|nr:hypothetical protein [Legionella sp.]OJY06082.1 MAG: hypothetical protein BGO90_11610 [Legionella sp. 40-6]
MSDLFDEDTDDTDVEVGDEFLDIDEELVEVEDDIDEQSHRGVDARRRLESMLDEKRLRDELDDFGDY